MKSRAFHTFIVNLTSLLQNAFSNSLICVWPQSCLTLLWSCRVWTVAPRPFCPWNFPNRNSGVSCHSPPPGDLPNSVTKLMSPASPALARGFFTVSAFWEVSFSKSLPIVKFSTVAQSCPLFVTPWTSAHQASLSITNSRSSLKLMSIKSVMPSSHLILCHPLLLLSPIPPSIRIFSNESTLHMRWPKYWSFSFSIIPSKEIPGLISFGMDWLDLLAVQGTLKSLLQHLSSKASILWCSAFFTVQLSHPYMTIEKTIALTRWTLVGKVMSLLLNMLSRLVITFLPRSKHLLISWLQSRSTVILEPRKIISCYCIHSKFILFL